MLKLVALVALFAGFCWVGTHLQLGPHTLFGHLRAIAQTKESQELFDGTRASAQPLVDDVRRRIAGVPGKKEPAEATDDSPTHKQGEVANADEEKPGKSATDSTKPDPAKTEKTKSESAKSDSTEDRFAHADHHPAKGGGPAQETLTPSERRRLRRLISSAEGASARQ
jgi:hypothetical protein